MRCNRFTRWFLSLVLIVSFLIGLVPEAGAASVTTSFSRPSTAYKQDGTQVASDQTRFETGKFGQAVMVEEGTQNLLTANQASVETDTTGFTNSGTPSVPNPGATLSRTTAEKWHGTASLQVVTPGSSNLEGFRTTGIAASAATTYVGSMWVKAPNGATLQAILHDATNDVYQTMYFTGNGAWQRVSVTLTTGASAVTDLRIAAYTSGIQAITFYVDGLQLEPKAYATSWQLPGAVNTVVLQPGPEGIDAYIHSGNPNSNTGSLQYLDTGNDGGGAVRPFLQFDLSSIPSNAVITSATLKLYLYYTDANNDIIGAYKVLGPWSENAITWTNAPQLSTVPESTNTLGAGGAGWSSWDITGLATKWVNGSIANYGLTLVSSNESIGHRKIFWSSDYTTPDLRPKLVVSYILSRAVESPTIPAAGVLSASEGTVEYWVQVFDVSNQHYGAMVTTGMDAPGPRLLIMRNQASSALNKIVVFDGDGNTESQLTSTTVMVANTWYHVAFTWSPNGRHLYVNGQLEASNTRGNPIGIGADGLVRIGAYKPYRLNGLIDNLRISSRARTDAEIAADYASGTTVQWTPDTTYLNRFDGSLTGEPVYVPANPSLTPITSTSMRGTWSANGNGATIQYRATLLNNQGVVVVGPFVTAQDVTSYDFTGLTPDETYTLRVSALNGGSQESAPVTSTPVPMNNPAPALTADSPTQITVSWSPVSGATTYRVFRDGSQVSGDLPAATTTFVDTILTANTQHSYTYTVSTDNGATWSNPSTAAMAYTLANAPTAATLSGVTQTAATGSWDTNGNPSGTTYEVSLDDGTGTVLKGPFTATSTSYSFSGLAPNRQYRLTVRAKNGDGMATAYAYSTATYTLVFQPTAGSTSATQTTFTATWGANGNPAGTVYEVGLDGNGGPWLAGPMTTTATSYTFTGLDPGKQYKAYVRAKNAADVVTDWTGFGVRRTIPATPILPEGLTGSFSWSKTAGYGWAEAQWNAITGATGYKVQVWDGQAYWVVADLPAPQTSWDSRTSKVFPPESAYASAANNSITGNPFCGGGNNPGYTCVDLRDDPNLLYQKTAGTSTDSAHSYFIRVTAYNESGESPPSPVWQPILANRIDTMAPQIVKVAINEDATVTGGKNVSVSVQFKDPLVANYTPDTGDDASGVAYLELSNDNATWTRITDATIIGDRITGAWMIKDVFGKQTVYARVIDAAGNVSAVGSDDIYYYMVDARAPSVSVTIGSGATVTSSRTVTLNITVQDDLTPPSALKMRFLGDVTNASSTWVTSSATATVTLTSGDGQKKVCVEAQDSSANVGQGCASITLQESAGLTAPAPATGTGTTGTVTVGGQQVTATFVKSPQVSLNTGGRLVEVSLDGLRWTSPGYVTDFSLPDWDGIKTVYIRYAGDPTVTKIVFVVDKTPPTVQASWLGNASVTNAGSATLVLNAQDNISSQSALQVSLDGGATWQAYATTRTVTFSGSGYKTLTVLVKDQAGNIASAVLGIYN